eukprot:SAG22_NODE_1849_length_3446_cov_3.782791_2_plen_554_part_00
MSFWKSDTRVAYGQKSIAIPAENGKQFNENAKVVIVVPPDVGFFQPSESYLQLRVKIDQPTATGVKPTRVQLDPELGGQVLIRNIRILTGTGILIEEIQDCNVLTNVVYSFDTDQNLRNKRSITEGTLDHNPSCRVDASDVEQTPYASANHNPYFTSPDDGTSAQQWAKLQLPLHTGIFRNKKIFPVMMTTGLRLEIMLEDSKKCVRNLRSTTDLAYAPVVKGTTQTNNEIPKDTPIAALVMTTDNGVIEAATCSFMVGETVKIIKTDGTGAFVIDKDIAGVSNFGSSPYLTKLTFANASAPTDSNIDVSGGDFRVLSTSVADNPTTYTPKYTVDEVELVLQQIQVPQNNVTAMMKAMKEQGVMRYDFLSYENYKRSQLAGERQSTMALQLSNAEIKSINAEIKSILSIATAGDPLANAGAYVTDYTQHSLVGIADNITNYQWTYNGVLNPDRRVAIAKLNSSQIEQQHLVELEKALVVGGIPAKSFRKFLKNVIIGRAMALQQGSYDGRGKDFNLQISNEETSAPAKQKLWMTFVCHVRSINISSEGVSLSI